jgi:hypothetical protein
MVFISGIITGARSNRASRARRTIALVLLSPLSRLEVLATSSPRTLSLYSPLWRVALATRPQGYDSILVLLGASKVLPDNRGVTK